jgi:hypothetical protein
MAGLSSLTQTRAQSVDPDAITLPELGVITLAEPGVNT